MNSVVSLTSDGFRSISDATFPFMQAYANKVNATFEYIDATDCSPYWHPSYKKRDIYDLLDRYDRVFFVDADAIILPECPDVFNIVMPEHFAGVPDAIQFRDHPHIFDACQQHYGQKVENRHLFINGGVFLAPRKHRDVLQFSHNIKETDPRYHWTFEQNELSFRLNMLVSVNEMHYLDPKFNAVALNEPVLEQLKNRNYILHYLGRMPENKKSVIPQDARILAEHYSL